MGMGAHPLVVDTNQEHTLADDAVRVANTIMVVLQSDAK